MRTASTHRPWFARVAPIVASLGPYAAIALLLPGGSIIALLVWMYRHWAEHWLRKRHTPGPG
jgi:hypothetical protein